MAENHSMENWRLRRAVSRNESFSSAPSGATATTSRPSSEPRSRSPAVASGSSAAAGRRLLPVLYSW